MIPETEPSSLRFRKTPYFLGRDCRFDESIRSLANVSAVQFAKSGNTSPGFASDMSPVTTTLAAPDAVTTPAAGTVRFAPTAIAAPFASEIKVAVKTSFEIASVPPFTTTEPMKALDHAGGEVGHSLLKVYRMCRCFHLRFVICEQL